jgi:acyl-CoA synthetase (AMP-forming)/AMP-acid ligase II
VPRRLLLVDVVPRLPNGKPDYRTAKEQARDLAQNAG